MNSQKLSIYDRIGGAPAIQAAVDIFYNKVISDDRINYWFSHMDMKAQRKKQETFLTMAFGGPHTYTGRDMDTAHQKLVDRGLNDFHFNAVAENLQVTLYELKVPKEIVDEVMALLESQRDVVLCRQKENRDQHISQVEKLNDEDFVKQGYRQYTLLDRHQEEGCDDKYMRLTFKLPDQNSDFNFQPGNHMQLLSEIDGKWIQRSYTPISDPEDPELQLLVKVYNEGIMSQYLSTLEVGTKLWMKGPNGHFAYRNGVASRINMFACGTGITPMWQILKSIAKNGDDKTEVLLIHGCRNENELVLRNDLNDIVSKHSNIRVSQTLSSPSEHWNGAVGRISDETLPLFKYYPADSNTINLLCGTDDFVIQMKKVLKQSGHHDTSLVIF